MSTAVEATGFVMGIIGFLLTGAALVNDYWKISYVSEDMINTYRQFVNLWHSCNENSVGVANCRDFESMLALPGYLQGCRALMIISLLFGLISMIITLLGLKCLKIGSRTDQSKAKTVGIGGIIGILAGLCCMTACSWYAAKVVEDFHNAFLGVQKYELGAGLYIGWGGASLSILGGILLCTALKGASSGKNSGLYGGAPKKVYTATARSEPESRAYV